MNLTRDAVDEAIKSGDLRKCQDERLRGMHYFADAEGRIYSYNRHEPSEIFSKPGNGGFIWVTLYTKEGIARFTVGDLVASAFVAKRPTPSHVIAYKDRDPRNNAPDNLYWEVDVRDVGELPVRASDDAERGEKFVESIEEHDELVGGPEEVKKAEVSTPARTEKLQTERQDTKQGKLIADLRDELNKARSANRSLFKALKPFAEFELPQSMHIGAEDKVVIEANVGLNNHCKLCVSDFERAKSAYEA